MKVSAINWVLGLALGSLMLIALAAYGFFDHPSQAGQERHRDNIDWAAKSTYRSEAAGSADRGRISQADVDRMLREGASRTHYRYVPGKPLTDPAADWEVEAMKRESAQALRDWGKNRQR